MERGGNDRIRNEDENKVESYSFNIHVRLNVAQIRRKRPTVELTRRREFNQASPDQS
jgi:hypothetical protein